MGDNASELGRTIKQLLELGRLERIDAARLQMARTMARTLDETPGNAALWREYRAVLKELTAGDSASLNDALADLFSNVVDAPPS